MTIRVRAKYANGALLPLESLPLAEGQEVVIAVETEREQEANWLLSLIEELHEIARKPVRWKFPAMVP